MKHLALVLLIAPALLGFGPQDEPAWFKTKLGRGTPPTVAAVCECCDRPVTPAMKPRAPAPPPPPVYGRPTTPEWFRTKLGHP